MTRAELESIWQINEDIDELTEKIYRIRERASSTVTNLSASPGGTLVSDKVGNGASKLADLHNELAERKRARDKIAAWISEIEPPTIRVMFRFRYLCGWSYSQIGRTLNSDRHMVVYKITRYIDVHCSR